MAGSTTASHTEPAGETAFGTTSSGPLRTLRSLCTRTRFLQVDTRTRGHSAKALWFFLHFLTARRSGAASFSK